MFDPLAGPGGTPCKSAESLWQDLIFVAQRLGFNSVKLTLENGTKFWQQPGTGGSHHYSRHEIHDGHGSVLELEARDISPGSRTPPPEPATEAGEDFSARLTDRKVFYIMSELLAEGWMQATRNWNARGPFPIGNSQKMLATSASLTRDITAPTN